MRVAVIGTGHVGLVSCVTLTSLGHDVVGIDQDQEKILMLRDGRLPFYEPRVDELLEQGLHSGKLTFSSDPADALPLAEVALISVGTPPRASGEANLVAVERAAQAVARHTTGNCVVVERSTVPTGTAARLRRTLLRENPDAVRLDIASNPEFLREGRAVEDALHPDRILVGAESPWVFDTMRRLYAPLIADGCPLLETDIATAELAKHACNAFLALKVSYANALARLCERAGADVVEVSRVMGTDPRIGPYFLDAGLGYGGSCFPKDLQAFQRLASSLGYPFPLLEQISEINEETLDATVAKIEDAVWNLDEKRIALLGLSFKPGTDDVRFSPALGLARRLIDRGARVVGYDPQAGTAAKTELAGLEIAVDPYDAAAGADCLVVCTEWDEFRSLDLSSIKEAMSYPIIVDGRNLFDPSEMTAKGFVYYSMGRA